MHYPHLLSFYLLSLVSVVIFLLGMTNLIGLMKLGKAETYPQQSRQGLGKIGKILCKRVLLQEQLYEQSNLRWFIHVAIYWGFLALFLQTVLMTILNWLVPPASAVSMFFLQSWGRHLLSVWGDFWGLIMLIGLSLALLRRYVFPSKQLNTMAEDAVFLWFLLIIVLTGFYTEGVRISLEGDPAAAAYSFVGVIFAKTNESYLGLADKTIMFWVHGVVSLALIAYLPFSKLIHAFTAPVEIVLSSFQETEKSKSWTMERGESLGEIKETAGLE